MDSPASDHPFIAPLRPDVVWFGGEDHVRFLNDLISQQIGDMGPGGVRRSMLLGPQGKVEFLLWVLTEQLRTGLMTESGRGEALAAALARYRIRVDVDVELEPRPCWIVVGAPGDFDVSWSNVERSLVIGDRPDLPDGRGERYEMLRISAGEPHWGVDVEEGAIPQETGLVDVSVDFDKGCFLGQELVARIDSRGGRAPRRLVIVESGGEIAAGMEIEAGDDDEAGMITSAVNGRGLAVVKRAIEDGATVMVGGAPAIVKELPAKSQR